MEIVKISALNYKTYKEGITKRLLSQYIENSDSYYKNSHNSLMDNSKKPILINRIIHNNKIFFIDIDNYFDCIIFFGIIYQGNSGQICTTITRIHDNYWISLSYYNKEGGYFIKWESKNTEKI